MGRGQQTLTSGRILDHFSAIFGDRRGLGAKQDERPSTSGEPAPKEPFFLGHAADDGSTRRAMIIAHWGLGNAREPCPLNDFVWKSRVTSQVSTTDIYDRCEADLDKFAVFGIAQKTDTPGGDPLYQISPLADWPLIPREAYKEWAKVWITS